MQRSNDSVLPPSLSCDNSTALVKIIGNKLTDLHAGICEDRPDKHGAEKYIFLAIEGAEI